MGLLRSVLRPITGVIGWGSIPLALVASTAALLTALRYLSIRLVQNSDVKSNKEKPMKTKLKEKSRTILSSTIETIWAAGVSSVAGSHLLA